MEHEGKNASHLAPRLKASPENMARGCFGLSRIIGTACRSHDKQDEFHKLLQSSRFSQLEKLYYDYEQRSHRRQMATDVLVQILQLQEVQSVKEYTVNGNTFKVYVVEDTEFWKDNNFVTYNSTANGAHWLLNEDDGTVSDTLCFFSATFGVQNHWTSICRDYVFYKSPRTFFRGSQNKVLPTDIC